MCIRDSHFFWHSVRALQSFAICLSISIEFKIRFEYVCTFSKVLLSKMDITPLHKEKGALNIDLLSHLQYQNICRRADSAPKLAPKGNSVSTEVDSQELGKIRSLQRGVVPATWSRLLEVWLALNNS